MRDYRAYFVFFKPPFVKVSPARSDSGHEEEFRLSGVQRVTDLQTAPESNNAKRLRVVLACGSRVVNTVMTTALQALSVEVLDVENSAELLSRIRAERPDIVMLQMGLDGVSTAELSRMLKGMAETRNIHIILFSTTGEAEKEALDSGGDHFIEFPAPLEKLREVLEKAQYRRKKILIIDDTKTIHEYIKNILKEEPYDLAHGYNGKQGIEVLARFKPDLVITDIEMPEMNGYDVCSWIKNSQEWRHLPVIISSTLSQGFEIDRGFDVGADDYMVKPVDPDELVAKLKSMLFSELKRQREYVLAVDDSKVILSLIGNALEQQGFRVATANDGEEGLRVAKSVKPSLVITDCEMPGLNGRDLTRGLKSLADFKHVPVIMLTAKETAVEKAKARKAGVSEFVSKPFTADKLLVIVERLLAESRVLRERDAMMSYMSDAAIKHAADIAKRSSGHGMTAYRDDASILFSDVCGFTTMSEKRTPEAIITLLNNYFDDMVRIIKVNGGTIDKFIGDAIMALFFGKTAEENAYNAVKSGFEMIRRLEQINAAQKDLEEHVHIRIGVNSGNVVFGDLGSKISRRDFTVIGDNVNVAQRLESKAPKDHVLISDTTYNLVRDFVEIEGSDELALKGKTSKLLCHVLKSVKPKNDGPRLTGTNDDPQENPAA